MADLETRGSVASRNTTRVTPATTASRTQRDIPLVVAGERPVVYNIARPRSRLHEIARGLGNLSQSLESREEQQSKVDEVAGRRAARTGEALTLGDIADKSEAFRMGAAAEFGTKAGYDALAELNTLAEENASNPEWDVEAARQEVLAKYFGSDPLDEIEATMVANGMRIYQGRAEELELGWRGAQQDQLKTDVRETFLGNAMQHARSLLALEGDDQLKYLDAHMQRIVLDGRQTLGAEAMDDINNQRLFIVETLAMETGREDLFNVFNNPDPDGTKLSAHRKWGRQILAARERVRSAVNTANAARNAIAKTRQILADNAAIKKPFAVDPAELLARTGLPSNHSKYLTPSRSATMIEKVLKVNAGERRRRADIAAVRGGQTLYDPDRHIAASRTVATEMAKTNPQEATTWLLGQYSLVGKVPKDFKAELSRNALSSDPAAVAAAESSYAQLNDANPNLARQATTAASRNLLDARQALRAAGFDPDDAVFTPETVERQSENRRTLLSSRDGKAAVANVLDDIVDKGVGTRTMVQERLVEMASIIAATQPITLDAALELSAEFMAPRLVEVAPNIVVDRNEMPFDIDDEDTMDAFKADAVAPYLERQGLPLSLVNELLVVPNNDDTVTLMTPQGANFGRIQYREWERMRRQAHQERAQTEEEQAILDAVHEADENRERAEVMERFRQFQKENAARMLPGATPKE